MRRLLVFGGGVAMIVIAMKQPWLTATTMSDSGLQMSGAGTWSLRGVVDPGTRGWPLQWPAAAGGAIVVLGSLTSRIFAYGLRVLVGSVVAASTALFAMLGSAKASGIPQMQLYGVDLHTGTAPQALLAVAIIAVVVAWSTPVPVDDVGAEGTSITPPT